jgi:hypothetical protein
MLAMVAGLESDLIRLRTWEGMKVAKAKGRLRAEQPKLNYSSIRWLPAGCCARPECRVGGAEDSLTVSLGLLE